MATSPAANIESLLNTQGLATSGTNMFVGLDPGGITLTVTLYDYAGSAPHPTLSRDEPRVQIMVFGGQEDYAEGYSKAQSIKSYLLGLTGQTIGSEIYFAFRMIGDINFVGYDANNRPMFSLNFRFYVDGPTAGNRTSI